MAEESKIDKGKTLDHSAVSIYLIPVAQAVLLHLVILGMFMSSWNVKSDVAPPSPKIIAAKVMPMVDTSAARRKQEEERLAAQRRAEQKRKAEARRKAEQKRKDQARRKKEADKKKQAEQKRKEEARRKAEQKRKAEEQRKQAEAKKARELERQRDLERQRELDIDQALAEESEYLQAESDSEAVMSYAALIQARVIQNWHRPLSARNGMEAILMIGLVPTGEVNNVYVVKSSGDAAFDRSALQAVQRAEKFEELRNLSPRLFDAQFRQFRLLFKPEDLER